MKVRTAGNVFLSIALASAPVYNSLSAETGISAGEEISEEGAQAILPEFKKLAMRSCIAFVGTF